MISKRHVTLTQKKNCASLGGTVDMAVFHNDGAGLREATHQEGQRYGGKGVNLEFEEQLKDIFGNDVVMTLKKSDAAVWEDLLLDFEEKKRTFENNKFSVSVTVPYGLAMAYERIAGKTLEDAFKNRESKDIKFKGGKFVISGDAMEKLYKKTVDKIYAAVHSFLQSFIDKSRSGIPPKYIFFVGGFAENKYLRTEMEKLETGYVDHKPKVLVPIQASLSVLMGAAKYGQNPKVIQERNLNYTYALEVEKYEVREGEAFPFDKDIVGEEGVKSVSGHLYQIATAGELVKESTIRQLDLQMSKDGESRTIGVFTTIQKQLSGDCDVRKFCSIKIEGDGVKRDKDRKVTLLFFIGLSEIIFRIQDSDNKHDVPYEILKV